MKKFLSLLLCLAMLLVLTGCGDSSANSGKQTADTTVSTLSTKPVDVPPETTAPPETQALTPEKAVEIYLANKALWAEDPEYPPMFGYGYCLVDLDFDGVLELISSRTDGTGRYSTNRFFRIDPVTCTVVELPHTVPEGRSDVDYIFMGNTARLLKNSETGRLFYVWADQVRISNAEISTVYAEIYLQEGAPYTNFLFSLHENLEDAAQNQYSFAQDNVSQAEYEQKAAAFYTENPDQHLTWTPIAGTEFHDADETRQLQLLTDAYRSFSYDGFSFQ